MGNYSQQADLRSRLLREGAGVGIGEKDGESSVRSSSSSLEMVMGDEGLQLDFLRRTFMSPTVVTLCGKNSQENSQAYCCRPKS